VSEPSRTRPIFLVAFALVALLVAYRFRGLVLGVFRGKTAPIQVVTLEGESAVLPRPRAAAPTLANRFRTSTATIEIGGARRVYVLVEPAEIDRERRYPLVLVFHGDGHDAESFHQAFRFETASGPDAFLAYPEGLGATWDLDSLVQNRDVELVEKLVEHLRERLPIDPARVFATGYSSGGFLANLVACRKSGLLRAITSSAGGAPYSQAMVWPNGFTRCPGQTPTAALALHGERDFGVTLDSGRFSAAYWAYVNDCNTTEMETTPYPECQVYRGCPAGKAVGFCSVPGLGHWVWDRAAEASWTFFRTQSE